MTTFLILVVLPALVGMITGTCASVIWCETRVTAWAKDERGTFIPEPVSRYLPKVVRAVEHRDGIPWFEARMPRFWHHCRAQSRGTFYGTCYLRCACGAARRRTDPRWICRNESRGQRKPPPPGSFMERRQKEVEQWDATLGGMLQVRSN